MSSDKKISPKRCAVIDDLSGYGKCSLGISIPILSASNIEVCPIPTALYTHHTAIEGFSCLNTEGFCDEYVKQWKDLKIQLSAIYTGYLMNKHQVYSAMQLAADNNDAFILVDPVLGDFGDFYQENGKKLLPHIKKLCTIADLITPNITEACLLTETEYIENPNKNQIENLLKNLKMINKNNIVLTGITDKEYIYNYWIDEDNNISVCKNKFYNNIIHGAGDVFSACLISGILNYNDIDKAIKFASDFVCDAVEFTINQEGFENRGICFEPFINKLTEMTKNG